MVDLRCCRKQKNRGRQWDQIFSNPVRESDLTEEDYRDVALEHATNNEFNNNNSDDDSDSDSDDGSEIEAEKVLRLAAARPTFKNASPTHQSIPTPTPPPQQQQQPMQTQLSFHSEGDDDDGGDVNSSFEKEQVGVVGVDGTPSSLPHHASPPATDRVNGAMGHDTNTSTSMDNGNGGNVGSGGTTSGAIGRPRSGGSGSSNGHAVLLHGSNGALTSLGSASKGIGKKGNNLAPIASPIRSIPSTAPAGTRLTSPLFITRSTVINITRLNVSV